MYGNRPQEAPGFSPGEYHSIYSIGEAHIPDVGVYEP